MKTLMGDELDKLPFNDKMQIVFMSTVQDKEEFDAVVANIPFSADMEIIKVE